MENTCVLSEERTPIAYALIKNPPSTIHIKIVYSFSKVDFLLGIKLYYIIKQEHYFLLIIPVGIVPLVMKAYQISGLNHAK